MVGGWCLIVTSVKSSDAEGCLGATVPWLSPANDNARALHACSCLIVIVFPPCFPSPKTTTRALLEEALQLERQLHVALLADRLTQQEEDKQQQQQQQQGSDADKEEGQTEVKQEEGKQQQQQADEQQEEGGQGPDDAAAAAAASSLGIPGVWWAAVAGGVA